MSIYFHIVFLFLNFHKLLCQDFPCHNGWVYSQKSGKCYINLSKLNNKTVAFNECSNILNMFKDPQPRTTLTRIQKDSDMSGLLEKLIEFANNEPLWMDFNSNSKWSDGTDVNVALLQTLDPTLQELSSCMTIQYYYENVGSTFSYKYKISNTSCSNPKSYVCEHDTNPCKMNIRNFEPDKMQLVPNITTLFSFVYIDCLPGFYRKVISSPTNNTALCTGKRDNSGNPSLYQSYWTDPSVDYCEKISCAAFTDTLQNVKNQIDNQGRTSYDFGYTFNVQCLRGYVGHVNKNESSSFIKCQQSPWNKSLGVWEPFDNKPCVEIKCDLGFLKAMIPTNARISSARNKVTQQQYEQTMQEMFLPLFNNIITFQCNDGLFYPDRTWSKEVICDLANNSETVGSWQGYLGTTMPLYSSCENATCKYELILITPTMNMKPNFMIMDNNGNFVNQTNQDGNPYPFNKKVMFECNENYSSALGNSSQILTCGPQGNWIPNLTPCIVIVPPIPSGPTRHYIPPPIEGSSAKQIGCVAIIIMAVFLSMIVVLDMSTVPRDIEILRTNIRNLNAAIKEGNRK